MEEFDVIVIGSGPAGQVCAGGLAAAGLEVAVVESHLVGGECAFYACMPSKALLRPEELRREVGRVPGLHPGADGPLVPETVLQRRDEVIRHLDDEAKLDWFEERDIALLRGHARLDGPQRVVVETGGEDGVELGARRAVVVATGSGATMPPIDGLEEVGAWNNRQATTAQQVPESMIVLGGGPVGCELAQAWASLGSKVTLIESAPRLLPSEEPFASEQVAASLTRSGVAVLTGSELVAVRRDADVEAGVPLVATLDDGREVRAMEIVVAVGRRPHVDRLGLETVGVDPDGPIEVDGRMRAVGAAPPTGAGQEGNSRPWLYAVGDVNGRVLLTHMGKYQARVATVDIVAEGSGSGPVAMAAEWGSPRVTFTDPQVAAVGLTEAQARERGIEIVVSEAETSGSPGASFHGRNTPGTSRLIADSSRGVLVGATFVGFETAELLHAATVAIVAEVPMERLRHAIPAFPTRSEIWLGLLDRLR